MDQKLVHVEHVLALGADKKDGNDNDYDDGIDNNDDDDKCSPK